MARPRNYEPQAAIIAARDAFWANGFKGTGVGALEAATGLGRSSLYLGFGSKRELFEAALVEYERSFIDILLGEVEAKGAGLREIADYFAALASLFRDPRSQRGCLLISSIVELGGRDPRMTAIGARFVERYHRAFLNALRTAARQGDMDGRLVPRRARLLATATYGAWVVVKADPPAAVANCRGISREVVSWGRKA